MLLKEGDMLGLILCACSVLQERNTKRTPEPNKKVTQLGLDLPQNMLPVYSLSSLNTPRSDPCQKVSVVICTIHTGHILARICIFSKHPKTFEQ